MLRWFVINNSIVLVCHLIFSSRLFMNFLFSLIDCFNLLIDDNNESCVFDVSELSKVSGVTMDDDNTLWVRGIWWFSVRDCLILWERFSIKDRAGNYVGEKKALFLFAGGWRINWNVGSIIIILFSWLIPLIKGLRVRPLGHWWVRQLIIIEWVWIPKQLCFFVIKCQHLIIVNHLDIRLKWQTKTCLIWEVWKIHYR